jgi:hypothetical protein
VTAKRSRVWILGLVTGVVLVVGPVLGYEMASSSGGSRRDEVAKPPAIQSSPLLPMAGFEARSGVRIVRVAVTGDGGLVDLRYQVLDPNAATSVHDKETPPDLVDERTGVVVKDLFMGHSHHGPLKAAQSYYLLFENPGNLVRRGSRVTVQLGAARVAHIPVR